MHELGVDSCCRNFFIDWNRFRNVWYDLVLIEGFQRKLWFRHFILFISTFFYGDRRRWKIVFITHLFHLSWISCINRKLELHHTNVVRFFSVEKSEFHFFILSHWLQSPQLRQRLRSVVKLLFQAEFIFVTFLYALSLSEALHRSVFLYRRQIYSFRPFRFTATDLW